MVLLVYTCCFCCCCCCCCHDEPISSAYMGKQMLEEMRNSTRFMQSSNSSLHLNMLKVGVALSSFRSEFIIVIYEFQFCDLEFY